MIKHINLTHVLARIKIIREVWRGMKTSELIKILKKNKCCVSRHGTRHDIWYSRMTGKEFAVPRHKSEIPIGTLRHILGDAGITID